ncbi:hypothetical protein JVT61DRAFT_10706 [Boletus reticuloceps]|uniref:Condensation domain-containing protein n=1 Tax=Boletus reticuloceps TaxID=495285 RepID=A0A8I2YFP3_9AGAM|nr:hypothetical protein JVT61DRAFT_10706 [Boletus reticuloceps]
MNLITSVGTTPFAGFFVAYNVLHKYSGQSTFVIGTAVTQRNLSNFTGFFANMLPIKTINETQTFTEYLKEFKTSLISCLAHDEVTYEDLVGLGKSSSGRGYFKHLFAPGGKPFLNSISTTLPPSPPYRFRMEKNSMSSCSLYIQAMGMPPFDLTTTSSRKK